MPSAQTHHCNYRHDEQRQRKIRSPGVDATASGAQTEMLALVIPEHEAEWYGDDAEEPERPNWRAEPQQIAGIANAREGANTEIQAVGDQAKPAKNRSRYAPRNFPT
jgi:hypothetical protein